MTIEFHLDPHNLLQHGHLYFDYFLFSHVSVVPFNFQLISATFCRHSSKAYQKNTYVLGSIIFPFTFLIPCARSRTCLTLEASVWVDALHASTIRLHHYHPLRCLRNMLWMMPWKLKGLHKKKLQVQNNVIVKQEAFLC